VIGWSQDAIRLTAESAAEGDALWDRYEAACPNEYRHGPAFKYLTPSEFPADLRARFDAFREAMGIPEPGNEPVNKRLEKVWRLEDKMRATPAQSLAGLLAKLRLLADELQRDHKPRLTIANAYRWNPETCHDLVQCMIASIWADAERLIGKGGGK
jgi:hypothetical protein